MLENKVFKHHEVLTISVSTFVQLGISNHRDVILIRKCLKVQVFWKAVREREEEARILFTCMIMQVACFFFFFFLLIRLEAK